MTSNVREVLLPLQPDTLAASQALEWGTGLHPGCPVRSSVRTTLVAVGKPLRHLPTTAPGRRGVALRLMQTGVDAWMLPLPGPPPLQAADSEAAFTALEQSPGTFQVERHKPSRTHSLGGSAGGAERSCRILEALSVGCGWANATYHMAFQCSPQCPGSPAVATLARQPLGWQSQAQEHNRA